MAVPTLALVGDPSPSVVAHQAIPRALALARQATGVPLAWEWVGTATLREPARDLARFAGVWLVPGSPYASMAAALETVRFARESGRPFLGTCGGFQHALLEIARHLAGVPDADHGETNPTGGALVITRLACSLVGQTETLRLLPASRLAAAYGAGSTHEGYHCNYGMNPAFRAALEAAGVRFTAFDAGGAPRAAEFEPHPFFVGTLFQPERAALRDLTPPLVRAFVQALASH